MYGMLGTSRKTEKLSVNPKPSIITIGTMIGTPTTVGSGLGNSAFCSPALRASVLAGELSEEAGLLRPNFVDLSWNYLLASWFLSCATALAISLPHAL